MPAIAPRTDGRPEKGINPACPDAANKIGASIVRG